MLTRAQLTFLLEVLELKNPQGGPAITVSIAQAHVAAGTYAELKKQLSEAPEETPSS